MVSIVLISKMFTKWKKTELDNWKYKDVSLEQVLQEALLIACGL